MSTATFSDQPCRKSLRRPAQHAAVGSQLHYERHRPEETTLPRLVQQNIETFFAQVEAEIGSGLPGFVKDEFDVFLECGILAHGFLRLRLAARLGRIIVLVLLNFILELFDVLLAVVGYPDLGLGHRAKT
jgi:hypothetical protein